jgi:hypothetical protein
MLSRTATNFPHRKNLDGSYDAICTKCFQTIASVREESHLAAFEKAHVCDPEALFQVSQCRVFAYEARLIRAAK